MIKDHSPLWCHALTLKERLASLRAFGTHSGPNLDIELARRRLKLWRAQPPFADEALWEQRCSLDQVSCDQLLQLLGEPIEVVSARWTEPLPWVDEVVRAYSDSTSAEQPQPLEAEPSSRPGAAPTEFLDIIDPLIVQGRGRLARGLAEMADRYQTWPFDLASLEPVLFQNLRWRLLSLLGRTVTYELGLARMLGRLEGETPEARYQAFLGRLGQPQNALKLLEEYPVLARLLVTRIEEWVNFSLELAEHLRADWDDICQAFSPEQPPGPLTAVEGQVADYHRQGRAVQILQFASGLKLVYKPKPLAVDLHFQQLLAWLNARGAAPGLRTITILDRGGHGWVEFVPAGACDTEDELRRFYERQGGYLALLYALEATDVHLENLIAAGEHPVLIDLESLFQGRPAGVDRSRADGQASGWIERSVMRVALLPQRLQLKPGAAGFDFGGLSGAGGELSAMESLVYAGGGTDALRFARQRLPLPATHNRPSLHGGQPADPLDFADAILAGFERTYRLLGAQCEALLAEGGPLEPFAEDPVRAIVSATRTYAQLLAESYHPVFLADALERDRHFDRLWDGVEVTPHLARVIAAERADLEQGDIPMFAARPNSRDITSSAGERIPDFSEEPPLEAVRRRLMSLGEQDLAQQRWFIRASLATLGRAREHDHHGPKTRAPVMAAPATRAELLAGACAIGDHLLELAWRGVDDANWVGLTLRDNDEYELAPLGLDLYEGLPGLALFLAQLGAVSGDGRYTELAQATLRAIRGQAGAEHLALKSLGAFSGWGGVIYTYTHLAALWGERGLWQEALDLCQRVPPLIEQDDTLDLMSGAAGCIPPLLWLHRLTGPGQGAPVGADLGVGPGQGAHAGAPLQFIFQGTPALAAAVACGEHLLRRARPMARGLAWPTPMPAKGPLTGFSHGAAGIAWALLELAAATGDQRYQTAALSGMEYERGLFSVEAGNWPDLRDNERLGLTPVPDGENYMLAWCHGAAGIGLARALCLPLIDGDRAESERVRLEILAAVRTTTAGGFGRNHCLCHGDLGNLELLWQATAVLGDERWLIEGERVAGQVLESIRHQGWQCGTPLGVESPGLMTGLAGIGYGLLRAAELARVPSVVTLAPPVSLHKPRSSK